MDGEAEGLLEEDDGALDDGGVGLGLAPQQTGSRPKLDVANVSSLVACSSVQAGKSKLSLFSTRK